MWPKRTRKNSQNHSKILHQGHYTNWWTKYRLCYSISGVDGKLLFLEGIIGLVANTSVLVWTLYYQNLLLQIFWNYFKLKRNIALMQSSDTLSGFYCFFSVWKLFVFLLSFGFSRILDSMITEKIFVFEMHIGCRIIGSINVIIDGI